MSATGGREVHEVGYGPWLPDPWRSPSGLLRGIYCARCRTILGRQRARLVPASMAEPLAHETALRLELAPLGAGPSGLRRYGLRKAEMTGKRPRVGSRVERVVTGTPGTRFYDMRTGREGDSIPARLVGWAPELWGDPLPSTPEPEPSASQRRHQKKRDTPGWAAGIDAFPAAPLQYHHQRPVESRPEDGFPGEAGVAFTQLAVTPCEVYCLTPQCGWHRVSGEG